MVLPSIAFAPIPHSPHHAQRGQAPRQALAVAGHRALHKVVADFAPGEGLAATTLLDLVTVPSFNLGSLAPGRSLWHNESGTFSCLQLAAFVVQVAPAGAFVKDGCNANLLGAVWSSLVANTSLSTLLLGDTTPAVASHACIVREGKQSTANSSFNLTHWDLVPKMSRPFEVFQLFAGVVEVAPTAVLVENGRATCLLGAILGPRVAGTLLHALLLGQ